VLQTASSILRWVDSVMARLTFMSCALVGSPAVVWLFRETIFEMDDTAVWVFLIGLPVAITALAGRLLRRPRWELVLGASVSAAISVLSLAIALVVACQGRSDCI
jgi:hypothetical protein